MTTTTAVPVSAGAASARRLAPLAGPGALVLLVASVAMVSFPDGDQSDATWTRFIASSSHRGHLVALSILAVLSAAMMIVFFCDLWSRMPGPSALGLVLGASGAIFVALGGMVAASAAWYTADDDGPVASGDLARFAQGLGYPLLGVCAFPLLGAAIAVGAHAAGRAGLLGRRTVLFGYVAAVFSLASFFFFPMALVLLWLAAAGVQLSRR